MTDRRRLHANDRVAHANLLGQVEAEFFVEGEDRQVIHPVTTLWNAPNGTRERELISSAYLEKTLPIALTFWILNLEGFW